MNQINQVKLIIGENPVFIIGHTNTDVDSYISMLLIEKLLKSFSINAIPTIFKSYDDLDFITKSIIEKLECRKINAIEIPNNSFVFLVDHNNIFESVNKNVNIVGIVDHHEDENIGSILKYVYDCGSTTEIIYNIFDILNIDLSYIEKKQVLYSLCTDTCALMSDKATEQDKKFAYNLSCSLNLNIDNIKQETLFSTGLNLPINKLANNGFKKYNINNYIVTSSYIEFFSYEEDINSVKHKLYSRFSKTKSDLHILILYDFSQNKTYVDCFGRLSKYIKGFEYDNITSRGKTIIPLIRNQIKNIN